MLTHRIVELSGGLLTVSSEPSDERYLMFNTGSVEVEVAEFLYALVRLLKPALVLETGTHKGVSAAYMGYALRSNGMGALLTLEYEQEHVLSAQRLLHNVGVEDFVEVHQADSRTFETALSVDLLFLDSEPQQRFAELLRFLPNLRPGGFALIHDLHEHMGQVANEEHGFAWPYGPVPEELIERVADDQLRVVHFPNPRGMTMFQKMTSEAFSW